jgi:hypothetical protein
MPINYKDYNENFKELSKQLKTLADWRCQICGLEHKTLHPKTGKKVILSTMHLDQDKKNDSLDNLKVACLGCHSRYDVRFRVSNWIKRIRKAGQRWFHFAE